MRSNAERAWECITLSHEMLCDKEFSPILCKKCEYYYVIYGEYKIAHCLKQDIREWTLYRISKNS